MNELYSENSNYLLKNRYLQKNDDGKVIESPKQLFKRVAKVVSEAERNWSNELNVNYWEDIFYTMMSDLIFLPNSPTLMNAGSDQQQLSACFVLPVFDSMKSIHDTYEHAKIIQNTGGGIGFNFSKISPKNNHAYSLSKHLSGPISVIEDFNELTNAVKLVGRRRGANMAILDINHPDIEEFIDVKRKDGALSNFNLSIAISDEFMQAVSQNDDWELIHPNYKYVVKQTNAKALWNKIIDSAWATGDPGVLFIDTINNDNPTLKLGQINATNPCGEVPLLPYESCNLGSLNLVKFLKLNKRFNEINWKKLEENIKYAVRFLDNVIEINQYITPEIKKATIGNRKIGLGVMGWAELLILLEIPYDSEKAVVLGEKLMQFIQEKAMEASIELAKDRGVFPNWEKSIYAPNTPIRNATRTSIAPTGSISIIANTTSSIEPLFALAYQQNNILNEKPFTNVNINFVEALKKNNIYSDRIMHHICENGSAADLIEIPMSIKNLYKTAIEIAPEWHLKHLLAFQKHIENGVSKTINLAESATKQEVAAIYNTAYAWKAKGISVYRNKSKKNQVINQGIISENNPCNMCNNFVEA